VAGVSKPRSTLNRYILYQIPGWLLAVAVAVLLHRWAGLPAWAAAVLVVVWALKDAALYPFLRTAYQQDSRRIVERLIGLVGVAVDPLAPRGYVRVRGELWLAEPSTTDLEIPRGHEVTVDAVRGTTLLVSAVDCTVPTVPS
jgi:membrane protein implicated in regulation of membrane protease activity